MIIRKGNVIFEKQFIRHHALEVKDLKEPVTKPTLLSLKPFGKAYK